MEVENYGLKIMNDIILENNIDNIKERGYTKIPQAFTSLEVNYMLTLVKGLYENNKDKVAKDTPYLNTNQPNVYNLQNKSYELLRTLFERKDVENVLKYFLNDKWYKQIPQEDPNYILRAFGARSSNIALPLHIDSFIPYKGEESIAMQVAIMLEDSTIENGCTLVVPGSHQSGDYAKNELIEKAIPLEAKAGDILIWDSRIWHGTTNNKTEGTRWAIIATFTRWWVKQMFDIPKHLPYSVWKHCDAKTKYLLGYGSIPHGNEFLGIEMKRGYKDIENL